ncbi:MULTISPECIES: hypothetical protein [unclassified Crossiella]|uniref:hypothetical protein n=1 Tax=unclassified Crossiella TaxID=2620835 RepID=UPI001FFF6F14|nr:MULTISPECIES: hypothetical protein [unclassified Crossiella]MCK2240092.1 hypothetical protein [Crossiella sp. S99.2]MCK2252801.1 hypothetical protein [Crossiella sp. S99.1]
MDGLIWWWPTVLATAGTVLAAVLAGVVFEWDQTRRFRRHSAARVAYFHALMAVICRPAEERADGAVAMLRSVEGREQFEQNWLRQHYTPILGLRTRTVAHRPAPGR